jgi:hypothetical protein
VASSRRSSPGISSAERLDPSGQAPGGEGHGRRQGHHPATVLHAKTGDRPFEGVQTVHEDREEPRAGDRQADAANPAHEQRLAQMGLQLAHLMADRGGRDRQFLGRQAETESARRGLEGAQG